MLPAILNSVSFENSEFVFEVVKCIVLYEAVFSSQKTKHYNFLGISRPPLEVLTP